MLDERKRGRRSRRLRPPGPAVGIALVALAISGLVFMETGLRQPEWLAGLRDAGAFRESVQPLPNVLGGGDAMRRSDDSGAAPAGNLRGHVTHVRDGDTIEVSGRPIRLASLDCSESGTFAGESATRRMKALVAGQGMTCSLTGRRSYDRWIGSCRLPDGRDIGEIMISEGLCGRWR